MQSNIKIVFFDLGGVVYNFTRGFAKLSKDIDRPQTDVENAYLKHGSLAGRGKISIQQFWMNFREELNLLDDSSINDYFMYWINTFSPITDTHSLIHELSQRYTLGIITNTELGVFEAVVNRGLVPDVDFSLVVKSCDVGFLKPEKEIYTFAQDNVNYEANQILFIDDKSENIEAAISLGWHGIVFDEKYAQRSVQKIKDYLK